MIKKTDERFAKPFARAKQLLSENGYTKDCYPLEELVLNIAETEKNVNIKVHAYKWSGLALLVSIPVISAFLSVLVTQQTASIFGGLQAYSPHLSVILTLLTLLNSIFKPGERFRAACLMAIKISHFRSDLFVALGKLTNITDTSLLEIVHKQRTDFELYQEQLVGLFLPETVDVRKARVQ